MRGIEIYLVDEDFNGAMILKCSSSNCLAVRAKKSEVGQYNELNAPGIYFLLVGNDAVYVGQSGLNTVANRIMSTHSGNIDSSWHTALGFVDKSNSLQSNELLYIENAMCQYVHNNYPHCLTSSPSTANCNESYRNSHYNLSTSQIYTCKKYISDILQYLKIFPNSIFPQHFIAPSATSEPNVETFYFKSPQRDSEGKAVIQIHLGHRRARQTILKAGSRISVNVQNSCSDSVKAQREQLEAQGVLINRVLQEDIVFQSQSGAGQFLNGASFDGNSNWKTVNGNIPLKQLLD